MGTMSLSHTHTHAYIHTLSLSRFEFERENTGIDHVSTTSSSENETAHVCDWQIKYIINRSIPKNEKAHHRSLDFMTKTNKFWGSIKGRVETVAHSIVRIFSF